MTLEEFKHSPKGTRINAILEDQTVIASMVAMSGRQRPAVMALDTPVAEVVDQLDNVEKQHIGRWVRDILAERGFKPVRQLDWRGGKIFRSGSVYAPIKGPAPDTAQPVNIPTALEQARARLQSGRIDSTQPIDTVDSFLKERRQSWNEA